jgi:hypothetical protein
MNPLLTTFLEPLNIEHVIDAGASDGRYSRELWPYLPNASYTLIDPIEYPDKWMGHNVEWIHKCLLDGSPVSFNIHEDKFRSGIYAEPDGVETPTVALADLLKDHDNVFIKFDTHGVEAQILSTVNTVDLAPVVAIQMEVYNFLVSPTCLLFDAMTIRMRQRGFALATVFDPLYRGDGALWQMDFLFVRPNHPLLQRQDFFYK